MINGEGEKESERKKGGGRKGGLTHLSGCVRSNSHAPRSGLDTASLLHQNTSTAKKPPRMPLSFSRARMRRDAIAMNEAPSCPRGRERRHTQVDTAQRPH